MRALLLCAAAAVATADDLVITPAFAPTAPAASWASLISEGGMLPAGSHLPARMPQISAPAGVVAGAEVLVSFETGLAAIQVQGTLVAEPRTARMYVRLRAMTIRRASTTVTLPVVGCAVGADGRLGIEAKPAANHREPAEGVIVTSPALVPASAGTAITLVFTEPVIAL